MENTTSAPSGSAGTGSPSAIGQQHGWQRPRALVPRAGQSPVRGAFQRLLQLARSSNVDRWVLAHPTRTAVYGPVRTVVWQGSAGDRRPYADQTALAEKYSLRLKADFVVHCTSQPLFAAQISLRRLYRDVPQQKLDLFQLAASGMTEPGARAATIVRRQFSNSGLGRGFLHDMPDDLLRDAFTPDRAPSADAPEQRPRGDVRRRSPAVDHRLYPAGHRHGTDVERPCQSDR